MDINKVYSKSLLKMLERKLLFKCQIKQLELQLKQNKNGHKQKQPKITIKDISREASPRQLKARQILKFQTHQPECLQNQVDQILKIMTQATQLCQKGTQKKSFSKRTKYENYRIATQQTDSNPQKDILNAKNIIRSHVSLPKIGKKFQVIENDKSSNRLKTYIYQQKNHQSSRIKTQNQVQTVINMTKHYRAGAISTKQLHKNINTKYF